MWSRTPINASGAGTVAIQAALAGKCVRLQRIFLVASGALTVDIQDTSGASLVGGPLTMATGTQINLTYEDIEDARNNPLFITKQGLGAQLVFSAGTCNGFVDFTLSVQ